MDRILCKAAKKKKKKKKSNKHHMHTDGGTFFSVALIHFFFPRNRWLQSFCNMRDDACGDMLSLFPSAPPVASINTLSHLSLILFSPPACRRFKQKPDDCWRLICLVSRKALYVGHELLVLAGICVLSAWRMVVVASLWGKKENNNNGCTALTFAS